MRQPQAAKLPPFESRSGIAPATWGSWIECDSGPCFPSGARWVPDDGTSERTSCVCLAVSIDPHRLAALARAVVRHAGGAPGPGCDLAALDPVCLRSSDTFAHSLLSRR